MRQYLDLMEHILKHGHEKADRTGTGTLSIFGAQMRFNLNEGFPLVTTKKVHLRSIIHELLWFLKGDTNTQYLKDNNVTIWDEWQNENGDLGPVYGKQWRDWTGPDGKHHDQIAKIIDQLRNDPDNRRIIVSAWNVGELDQMALAPCHAFFQFYTRKLSRAEREMWLQTGYPLRYQAYVANEESEKEAWLHSAGVPERALSCQLYQRSCDFFLGVPFNIASYALLTHMVAQQVNMAVEDFVWTGGDVHLYSNHLEQAKLQLTREPLPLPTLAIKRKPASIFDYQFDDFEVVDYSAHAAIKAPVAI